MGKLTDALSNIIVKTLADKVVDGAEWLLEKAFGDEHDDDDKKAVARAMVEAGAKAVETRAKLRQANEEMPKRVAEMYESARHVMDAFKPDGSIPDIGVVTIVCTLRRESWDAFLKAGIVVVREPREGDPEGCVGVVFDDAGRETPVVLGDDDREVPAVIQDVLDGSSGPDAAFDKSSE